MPTIAPKKLYELPTVLGTHFLSGPDQSVRRLGQVQVPADPRGLRRRPKRQEDSDYLLVPPDHGGQSGRVLRNGVLRGERHNAGQPAVPHHI